MCGHQSAYPAPNVTSETVAAFEQSQGMLPVHHSGHSLTCAFCGAMWCILMQRECVTRGVRVRAAAIFVPELSKRSSLLFPLDSHFFAYKYAAATLCKQYEQVTAWVPGLVHHPTCVHATPHKVCLQLTTHLTDCML